MKTIELEKLNDTPVFKIRDPATEQWFRVFGATYIDLRQCWFFPAFPPFIETVLQDIYNVNDNVVLTPEAEEWRKSFDFENVKSQVKAQTFHTKPYDHQIEGLSELLFNYRWILQWEMGTGKSKVIVDAVQQLKLKTLILCPLVGLDNWLDEMRVHSNKKTLVLQLDGNSPKEKQKQIQKSPQYDVFVVTYDAARLYGVPHLFTSTIKLFLKAERIPHENLKRILSLTSDSKLQLEATQQWLDGSQPRALENIIRKEIGSEPQWICDFPYTVIVADESHKIKRYKSARTKICLELSKKAARRYLLTGTLSHGDPRDLYTQLRFLAPYLMPENYTLFCERYVAFSPKVKHLVTGFKNLNILNNRVTRVSSVKKLDDCVSLPERQFIEVGFELSVGQQTAYNDAVRDWIIDTPNARSVVEIKNAAIRINKLLQICSGFLYVPKSTEVCDACENKHICVEHCILPGSASCLRPDLCKELLRDVLVFPDNPKLQLLSSKLDDVTPASKSIVWAGYIQELDDIEAELVRNGWKYVRVDGRTTSNISNLVSQFQNDPDCHIYLGQISTGIAINLTAAKYTFYYSRTWSLDHRLQSLGRSYRIGQKQKTVIYDLYAQQSLEVQQLIALNNKQDIARLLTEKPECTMCLRYRQCINDEVAPWETDCVLATHASRVVAKAKEIFGGIKNETHP